MLRDRAVPVRWSRLPGVRVVPLQEGPVSLLLEVRVVRRPEGPVSRPLAVRAVAVRAVAVRAVALVVARPLPAARRIRNRVVACTTVVPAA